MKNIFKEDKSKIYFAIFTAVIVILSILVASPYINTVILALIVAYIVQPIYKLVLGKIKPKRRRASLISTAIVMLATLLIGVILLLAMFRIMSLVITELNAIKLTNNQNADLIEDIADWLNSFFDRFRLPISITSSQIIENVRTYISQILSFILNALTSLGSLSVEVVLNLIIFYGMIFLITPNFDSMIKFVKKVSPFNKEITDMYISRTLGTSKAMAWGMIIIAIVQGGIVGAITFTLLGTPNVLLLSVILSIFAFLPLLGTGMITFPIAAIYIATGEIAKGIILALIQLIIIGNIDAFLRAKLIPKEVKMPLIISFISVFGGLTLFGIWGLIYGPVIFSLLLTTLEVIKKYYTAKNDREDI